LSKGNRTNISRCLKGTLSDKKEYFEMFKKKSKKIKKIWLIVNKKCGLEKHYAINMLINIKF
jgi:hypothetical protein